MVRSGKPDSDANIDLVLSFESKVWDAWCKRDLEALSALTATDYVAFDAEGVFKWPAVKEFLSTSELMSYDLSLLHAQKVSSKVIALSLSVVAQVGKTTATRIVNMSVLSVWAKRHGKWFSIVRHEMPTGPHAVVVAQAAHLLPG